MKSISIIAPAYNHEKYISYCLDSVADQDYPEKELIIIDDCSHDDTVRIIKEKINSDDFRASFPLGVRFIEHKENAGASFTLNEALFSAQGDYLTVINTDDHYGKCRISSLIEACESTDSRFAFGQINVVDQNDRLIKPDDKKDIIPYKALESLNIYPTVTMALCKSNSAVSTGNMLFDRNLFKELNGFSHYRYVHDWDFILRACLITEPVYVENAVYNYRIHTGNTITESQSKHSDPYVMDTHDHKLVSGENPLISFFSSIISGQYTNRCIPSFEIWDYALNHYYRDPALSALWNNAKTVK